MLFRFWFLLYLIDGKIIKNIDLPSCRNCKYYKPNINTYFSSDSGKCEYFGVKNIENNVIIYDYASFCREDTNKCGIEGKYFQEDENLYFKIFLHNIKVPQTLMILTIFAYLYSLSITIKK